MFIDELKKKSDAIVDNEKSVIKEICADYKKFLESGQLEKFIEKNLQEINIRNRSFCLCISFGNTQYIKDNSICQTTSVAVGDCGVKAYIFDRDGEDAENTNENRYRGVLLASIASDVVIRLEHITRDYMEKIGFKAKREIYASESQLSKLIISW